MVKGRTDCMAVRAGGNMGLEGGLGASWTSALAFS